MSVVLMSKRELNRLDVLARLDSDRLSVAVAAGVMNITLRQTYRLLSRYREGGASAIANQRRGRPSNNRLSDAVRDHAIALVRELYPDFGPTLAAEKLAERHDLRVSRETLRNWMRRAGIWVSRAERKRIQQPRHRREHIGELVQIDGSELCWFEDRAAPCTLLVFVDDATSRFDGTALCGLGEHDARLPAAARFALMAIADEIEASADQIDRLERAIVVEAKHDEDMRRLTTIPGVGAITAATIKALVPDPGGFKSARHFAAWLGLTPRPHSSGGKERLGRISKMGNPELRALLVVGATAVLRVARNDARARPWLKALLARRPFKVAAVAQANKTARIIWALLNKGGTYRRPDPLAITAVAV